MVQVRGWKDLKGAWWSEFSVKGKNSLPERARRREEQREEEHTVGEDSSSP